MHVSKRHPYTVVALATTGVVIFLLVRNWTSSECGAGDSTVPCPATADDRPLTRPPSAPKPTAPSRMPFKQQCATRLASLSGNGSGSMWSEDKSGNHAYPWLPGGHGHGQHELHQQQREYKQRKESCLKDVNEEPGHAAYRAHGWDTFRYRQRTLVENLPVVKSAGGPFCIDVGGNIGMDSKELLRSMKCRRLEIFEVLPKMASDLASMFPHENVCVSAAGLSNAKGKLWAHIQGENQEASFVDDNPHPIGPDTVEVPLVSIVDYVAQAVRVTGDDALVMHINCEGCEFDIIPALIDSGLIHCISAIEMQAHEKKYAHRSLEAWKEQRCQMSAYLGMFFDMQYHFNLVWELWTRKEQRSDTCLLRVDEIFKQRKGTVNTTHGPAT